MTINAHLFAKVAHKLYFLQKKLEPQIDSHYTY